MGIYDRDWYREHQRKIAEQEKEQRLRIRIKRPRLPKKESFQGLIVRAFIMLVGCWAIIEAGLRLKH